MGDEPGDWGAVEQELGGVLADLSEREYLVVGEPSPARPARGPFRRTPPPPPHRYVQFRGDPDWLYAECVGAERFGGPWPVPLDLHEQLRQLGWLAPGDPDPTGTRPSYPNYWCTRPRRNAAEMATMGVGALRLLGLRPCDVRWERET